MSTFLTRSIGPIALATAAAAASAATPINLSSWQALTLNYPGGQGAGNWVLEPGNTAVKQVINADPSFYLNGVNQGAYTIEGTWQVLQTGGDDDYMGFVFGYQNSSSFYAFDWKQTAQSYVGTNAAEGMTIKKFRGATGSGLADLSLEEFWENEEALGDMTVLATNHSSSAGWLDNVLYTFSLDFNATPGQFRVIVKNGEVTLWDRTVQDNTFTTGQFGFFNNSQQNVRYAGFVQEVIDPEPPVPGIPEPETYALMLAGLALVGAAARRRRQ